MQKLSVFKRIALTVLSIIVIGMLYYFIWYKESFDRPIRVQVIATFCFLMMSINNFRLKDYAMGWIFAGVVLVFSISIFWTSTTM